MKKIIVIWMLLYFSITCYLIRYEINDVKYRIFYDVETDIVEMWTPKDMYLNVPIEIKQHWIDNYNNHYDFDYTNKLYDWNKYGFVEGFGR